MRRSSPLLNSLLVRCVLALLLLFAQQQAAQHWLSHAVEGSTHKAAHTPAGDSCDECSILAALGGAAPAPVFCLPAGHAGQALAVSAESASAPAVLWLAYLSRAPPALL